MRGDSIEVWTLKDFNANKLAFGPEANEIKERNWSQNRVALVKYDTNLHPHKLHMVIDGRLRSTVCDSRPFSLYFAVTTSATEKEADANMTVGYVEVHADVGVKLPWGEKVIKTSEKLPQIPVMYNKKKINAHTKLVCSTDASLQNISAVANKKRVAELIQEKTALAKKVKAATEK